MTAEDATQGTGEYRKRRRAKKATRTKGDWQTRFRDQWRRFLNPAMAVLAVGWGGYVYVHTFQDTAFYNGLDSEMTAAEVRYGLGEAHDTTTTSGGRERWLYVSGSQRLAVDFGADGRIANVLCTSTSLSPGDCLSSHGITLGMTEHEVWYRLGDPPVEQLDGTSKIIAYPALGLTLRLAQVRVSAIALQPRRDILGAVPPTIRMLVP